MIDADITLLRKKKGDLEEKLPIPGRTVAALNIVKRLGACIECLTSGFEHSPKAATHRNRPSLIGWGRPVRGDDW